MKIPRFLHGWYAFFTGHFWIPCPLCGKKFGGHEKNGNLMLSWSTAKLTCERCAGEAQRLSSEWMEAHPFSDAAIFAVADAWMGRLP